MATLAVVVVYVHRVAPSSYRILAVIGYSILALYVLLRLSMVVKYAVYDRSITVICSLIGFVSSGVALLLGARWLETGSTGLAVAIVLFGVVSAFSLVMAFHLSAKAARRE